MLDSEGFVAAGWAHNLGLHCRFSEEIFTLSQCNFLFIVIKY